MCSQSFYLQFLRFEWRIKLVISVAKSFVRSVNWRNYDNNNNDQCYQIRRIVKIEMPTKHI